MNSTIEAICAAFKERGIVHRLDETETKIIASFPVCGALREMELCFSDNPPTASVYVMSIPEGRMDAARRAIDHLNTILSVSSFVIVQNCILLRTVIPPFRTSMIGSAAGMLFVDFAKTIAHTQSFLEASI